MPKLWQTLRGRRSSAAEQRDWMHDRLIFEGITYPLVGASVYGRQVEQIENSFTGYVNAAYKSNGIIFAVILARMLLFSEARFQWQRLVDGRPGDLFGSRELEILERPWPNGTTGELLARMEQDVSLAGNFFAVRDGDRVHRLRPDWVEIILSAPPDQAVRSDVVGYRYTPGGPAAGGEPEIFLPEQVCHWTPIPDPDAQYRGMSWITPIVRELQADRAATEHKARFFENAATPNLAVSLKESLTPEQFREFVDAMDAQHKGVHNAYKTLYTAGGADVTVIGADLQQLDFKATQGAGETRICAAGGVPPIIVGLSEGLQASTYSNYGMARRKFGDHWARPQWRSACAALAALVRPPAGGSPVRLWFDDRDIAFLREDERDRAEIAQIEAQTMAALVREGWTADSVVRALMEGDWGLLQHSGLYSVQLWPPGTAEANASPETSLAGADNDQPAGSEDGDAT
ncbi:phage portal protein [uncultured Thermomonospora sp.]|uniref:phage portal protein n=1 Tax=uncultured Thermomonospora sp. TaxID=671175 RepID=UPI00259B41D9|nr:phage portal protein [uncultured Thermomonospora sp.]